jgi:hypothetical protein
MFLKTNSVKVFPFSDLSKTNSGEKRSEFELDYDSEDEFFEEERENFIRNVNTIARVDSNRINPDEKLER